MLQALQDIVVIASWRSTDLSEWCVQCRLLFSRAHYPTGPSLAQERVDVVCPAGIGAVLYF